MVHFRATTAFQVQTKVFIIFPLLSFLKKKQSMHCTFTCRAQHSTALQLAWPVLSTRSMCMKSVRMSS